MDAYKELCLQHIKDTLTKKVERHSDIVADKIASTGKTPFRKGKLSAFSQVIQWVKSLKPQH